MRERRRGQTRSILRTERLLSSESFLGAESSRGEGHRALNEVLCLLFCEEREALREPVDPLTIFKLMRGLAAAQQRRESTPAIARLFILE